VANSRQAKLRVQDTESREHEEDKNRLRTLENKQTEASMLFKAPPRTRLKNEPVVTPPKGCLAMFAWPAGEPNA